MNWQSIETAPKDGRLRLLYFPAITKARHPSNNKPELIEIGHGIGGPFRFATYWCEIPPPPKDIQG